MDSNLVLPFADDISLPEVERPPTEGGLNSGSGQHGGDEGKVRTVKFNYFVIAPGPRPPFYLVPEHLSGEGL